MYHPYITNSFCNISKQDNHAQLLRSAHLIIWDKVSMQHRFTHESLNCTLHDFVTTTVSHLKEKQSSSEAIFNKCYLSFLAVHKKMLSMHRSPALISEKTSSFSLFIQICDFLSPQLTNADLQTGFFRLATVLISTTREQSLSTTTCMYQIVILLSTVSILLLIKSCPLHLIS